MKRTARIIASVLLSGLILLGSGGIIIGKMICGSSACSTTYSLGYAKDCCEKSGTTEKIKSCCCELINVSYALDDFNFSSQLKISEQAIDVIFRSLSEIFFFALPAWNVAFYADIPPPTAKEFLIYISLLLL